MSVGLRRHSTLVASVAALAVGVVLVASARSLAASKPAASTSKSTISAGAQLYRKYCGQCHSLAKALSAGFGNNTKGVGRNGGPSFNQLRVPYSYSVNAVAEPTGGHELVRTRISPKQLSTVATFIATATRTNPIPALPTDG
jgi:mono/diheme cytochrome c family protein